MSESTDGTGRVQPNRGPASQSEKWSLLVVRMAGGDSTALSEFYDEANRYVHAIALRILRDPDEAEEITLDVFQQVWKLAANYNPERCAVPSWIAMMARSRALDRWRSLQARRRFLAAEQPADVEYVSPDDSPEVSVAAAQERSRLRAALITLPEEQRSMLTLAFWDGLSHSEVSARTGVPLGTVKTRIRLGMLKLREELANADNPRN